MSHRPTIIAVIPVGSLDGAKSRLGAVLDAEERRDLVTSLADRTIRAVVATTGIAEALVVTPDDDVRELALTAGARPLRQRGHGLNAGLRQAREEAVAAGARAILIVPIDLPRISPEALERLLAVVGDPPERGVVLVPDRHGRGTNALLLAPPDVIDVHFGGDSRDAHAAAATAVDAPFTQLDGPLTEDLDTPDDLLLLEATAPGILRG